MMKAPEFDVSPLDEDQASEVKSAFARGIADKFPARTLVRAGVVKYHALRGGIFWRREPVKYIVMHSTETGIPVSGIRVIESWSSMGRRHPGAQYVVDRDGSIIQSVDPDLATVHINILKTLPGINNDNSIGIEMNHTGSQEYPDAQLQSVIKLVTYLQDRYGVPSENIITHRYAQQGDHTDPVHFDWKGFLWSKDRHRNEAIAYKMNSMDKQSRNWGDYKESPAVAEPPPETILQPHMTVQGKPLPPTNAPSATPPGSNAPIPPIKAPVVMFDVVKPTEPIKGPNGFVPSIIVPAPAAAAPSTSGPRATTPATTTPSTTTPATKAPSTTTTPAPSAMPAPSREITSPHGLPPLRGPIEVGPEHAGDLTAPRQ